jgi:hypothetical protein
MGEQRQKTRVRSKIDDLPPDVKVIVDLMLADTRNTYQMITDYIRSTGNEISKSAVGAYALRRSNAAQRLKEAQEQTRTLVEVIKQNPDLDYTEGAMQIMIGELTKKLATAEEEWSDLPLDKAGRLVVALSRTKAYKDKIRAELSAKVKLAFEEFLKVVKTELENRDPELCNRLISIANQVAQRIEAEE